MRNKILIVEDEELYAVQLEIMIDKLGHELVGVVDNSNDALQLFEEQMPDLVLMDVHIRGQHDGVELSGLLREIQEVPIIFITSLKDDLTFQRARRADANNFIIKPFDQLQLQRAIQLALHNEATRQTDAVHVDAIFIKNGQKLEKILFEDIYFLQSSVNCTWIYTSAGRHVVYASLRDLIEKLPATFVQTHRSFVVNKSKVVSIDSKEYSIELIGHTVPISRRNYAEVIKAIGDILK